MANDEELLEKVRDLYNRLGGASNSDACILRDLWLRFEQERKLTKRAGGRAVGSMPRSSQNGLGIDPAEMSNYTARG